MAEANYYLQEFSNIKSKVTLYGKGLIFESARLLCHLTGLKSSEVSREPRTTTLQVSKVMLHICRDMATQWRDFYGRAISQHSHGRRLPTEPTSPYLGEL